MKLSFLHIAIAVLIAVHALDAQQLIIKRQETMRSYGADAHVADVMKNGTLLATSTVSENEMARLIVEVAQPSMAQPSLKKTVVTQSAAAASLRMAVRARLEAISPETRTLREFSTIVNGYCITTQRKNLSAIRALSGVSRVVEDLKVSSCPVAASTSSTAVSSPLAGIATGKGVRIGIIDTGIDYHHEALGGGFGAGYKVCGGYDFVNSDSDPMDDNGHGTHVAGIIGGLSQTIVGLASGASLYAYKALDANGEGYSSTVIAAIERAMQDSVKVINMSLGTSAGDPDDLLSQAVDRAAASGIVVVAAAGNGGDFGTIGSPGAARSALTVGAVDGKNVPASFSSKGPVQKDFGMKPEVVAPGVSILSAKSGGGYIAMSGTSMSAPYVAAMAADLFELYPGMSAAQVRNGIIESAQSLPYSYFTVGSGKADPLKAMQLRTVAAPGLMSLGFNANTTAAWQQRETVYVANVTSAPQSYAISGSASATGITIQCTPAQVSVAPHDQAMILVDVRADNALLADNATANDGYSGAVTGISATDTIRIPFAFFKGTMLRLEFDDVPWQVILHNRKDKSYAYAPKTTGFSVVVAPGTYDVLTTFYPSTYVVHEGVQASGVTDVVVNRTEATHPVTIVPTDENGAVMATDLPHEVFSSIEGIIHRASGVSLIAMSGGLFTAAQSARVIYLSDVSPAYVFGCTINLQKDNTATYTYETAIDTGITAAAAFRFKPEEISRLEVKYAIDSSKMHTAFPIVWSYLQQQGTMTGTTYYDGTAAPLSYPFTQTSFYYKRTSPAFPIFHYREAYKY